MSTLLLTLGVTCEALAQEQKTNLKKETVLINHNGAKFCLYSHIEIPADNPAIERLLCEKTFGNADGNLETALKEYVSQFDKSHMEKKVNEHKKYSDGTVIIGIFHSNFFKRTNFVSEEYKEMSKRYAPFYYYIKKESKHPKMDNVDIKEVKGWFTYDMETGKLLNFTDVFTKEAIEKLKIDVYKNNEDIFFSPYNRKVAYFDVESGNDTIKEYSINNDSELFTERIKPFSIEIEKRQKEIEEKRRLQTEEMEKRQKNEEGKDKPLDIAEVMPSFPGGDAGLMKWLSKNIRYPNIAERHGIEGRVIVRFAVGEDGTIRDPMLLRSVHPALDKEALRVTMSMPRWIPGKQNGKAVSVYFTLPITFYCGKRPQITPQ